MKESPLKDEIGFPTKIFSTNTKADFLSYLDDILNKADSEHLKLVNEVYGEDWGNPYVTILERYKEDK